MATESDDNSLIDFEENNLDLNESLSDLSDLSETEEPQKTLENHPKAAQQPIQEQEEKNKKLEEAKQYLKKQRKKGVCYIARIPRFMNITQLKLYFERFKPGRVYLTPESDKSRKERLKNGGNRSRLYIDGWIEFMDKRVAKLVAVNFNGRQVGGKKKSQCYEDIWMIRYLPKFKWENLLERIEYDKRVRAKEFSQKVAEAKKKHDFFLGKLVKAKKVRALMRRKVSNQ